MKVVASLPGRKTRFNAAAHSACYHPGMPQMPSLDNPTDGQRERARSLIHDGYTEEEAARFLRAEWREAQRIALDACSELHPLSNVEQKLVRGWLGDLVPAEEIRLRLIEKRAAHLERDGRYRQGVNARRALKKAEKRAKLDREA